MEIKEKMVVGQMTIEEQGYGRGKKLLWWCRCSCGTPTYRLAWQIEKAIKNEIDLCCKGCSKRKKQGLDKSSSNLKETIIYLMHITGTDSYKIGHGKSPEKRRSELQVGSPSVITIIVQVPGTIYDEWELHQEFEDQHIRGEWFKFSQDELINVELAFTKLRKPS